MKNATRIAVAASAISALAVIACSSSPTDDAVSVEVEQGTVDPNCIKGGITCGTVGASSGNLASSSGLVFDPGTSSGSTSGGTSGTSGGGYQPPGGVNPDHCGPCIPVIDLKGRPACDCRGGGNGLQSGIGCPPSTPCQREVWGVYRCYRKDPYTQECRP